MDLISYFQEALAGKIEEQKKKNIARGEVRAEDLAVSGVLSLFIASSYLA